MGTLLSFPCQLRLGVVLRRLSLSPYNTPPSSPAMPFVVWLHTPPLHLFFSSFQP